MVSTLTPVGVCLNMLPKHKRRHAGYSYGAGKPTDVAMKLWSMYRGLTLIEQAGFIAGAITLSR